MILLEGRKIKQDILESLKEKTEKLETKPQIAIIQVGSDPASNVYIKNKINMCNKIGYKYQHIIFDNNAKENEIINKIIELNNDNLISSIIVQMPLPKHLNTYKILNTIKEEKDVDGLTNNNMIKLINNKESLIPCTPLGILTMLEYYHIELLGKNIVVVGRSNLVGKPLFNLLINKDATVTLCHSKTINLEKYTKQADILIVAVGKSNLITKDMVKEDSVVIDVGINRENDKLCGDVDFENVKEKVKYITPVPGGVGQLTVASLAQNILKSYYMNKTL